MNKDKFDISCPPVDPRTYKLLFDIITDQIERELKAVRLKDAEDGITHLPRRMSQYFEPPTISSILNTPSEYSKKLYKQYDGVGVVRWQDIINLTGTTKSNVLWYSPTPTLKQRIENLKELFCKTFKRDKND